jgi:hypothetical protein
MGFCPQILSTRQINFFKEEKAMKTMVSAVVTILSLFIFASAGYADIGDLVAEGNVLMKYSQQLIDKGQMLKAFKDQDKTWMVDQGHQMLKEGMDIIEKGEMMYTGEGRSNTQEVGGAFRSAGSLLLKMGRKKDALTVKDKEKIVKHGKTMMGLGKLMLEKGKMMAP